MQASHFNGPAAAVGVRLEAIYKSELVADIFLARRTGRPYLSDAELAQEYVADEMFLSAEPTQPAFPPPTVGVRWRPGHALNMLSMILRAPFS